MTAFEPDPRRLEELLVDQLPEARDASVTRLDRVFGGNARRAWSFDATWRHAEGASELAGILLCQVQPGQLESDPAREFGVLRGLEGAGVRAPGAVAVDERGAMLGAPSLVLARMPGAANVMEFLKPSDPALSATLSRELARATAELHDADWRPAGLGDAAADADRRAVARTQIAYWEGLFEGCRLEPQPVLAGLFGWLHEHLPEPARLSVVHGDLRPGNFLHEGDRLTALLDWEMAHLGDPAEDLAWAYRPLWSPQPFLDLDAFLDVYDERAAVPADRAAVRFYRVFSEVKFATISLRAARVFHDGVSSNLRLADRAAMVTGCLRQALEWTAAAERQHA